MKFVQGIKHKLPLEEHCYTKKKINFKGQAIENKHIKESKL